MLQVYALQFAACFACVVAAAAEVTVLLDDAYLKNTSADDDAKVCASAGHDGSFHHIVKDGPDAGEVFFAWEFTVKKDGCYRVEEHHPNVTGSSCVGKEHQLLPQEHVPIRIDFCRGGVGHGYVDQSPKTSGLWNKVARLPFYVGWVGKISIKHDESVFPPMKELCPGGKCLWLADAFKVTWLAVDCKTADEEDRAAEAAKHPEHEQPPTASELADADAQADHQGVTSTMAPDVATTQGDLEDELVYELAPPAALQISLTEPRLSGIDAVFEFEPPLDGCYVVEEKHPHVPGADGEELTVNYCKGLRSVGQVDHTNGRHGQWNYVASLPFYNGHPGSMVLSRSLLALAEEQIQPPGAVFSHEFRVTHVGPRCHHRDAEVFTAQIRINANFALVKDKLPAFKAEIAALLAPAAGVHSSRVRVADAWEGSIVAELTVMPPGLEAPTTDGVDARTAVVNLQEALAAGSTLGATICSKVGADASCSVAMETASSKQPLAAPLGRRSPPQPKDTTGCWLYYAGIGAVVAASVALLIVGSVCYNRRRIRRRSMATTKAAKNAAPLEEKDIQVIIADEALEKEMDPDKKDDERSSTVSTATPDDVDSQNVEGLDSLKSSDLQNVEAMSGTPSETSQTVPETSQTVRVNL